MKTAIEKLFSWWREPRGKPPPVLSSDFAYTGSSSAVRAEDWIYEVSNQVPWREVRLVGLVAEDANGAVCFEGTDPVTLLRHRVCWWVEGRDGRIATLTETVETVEAPPDADESEGEE